MPTIEDLLTDLKALLSPTDDGAFISDEMALTLAIDEIKRLRAHADRTAWRDVATDPPPESTEVLFYGGGYWVGYAKTITFHDIDTGEETEELAYYFEGDLMDGDLPTVWCHIPPDDAGNGEQAGEEKGDGEE